MNKLILPVTWMVALIVLILFTTQLNNAATHFFGIADNQEQTISFSYPVQIETIDVVEGEQVDGQQVVLRVTTPDLASKKAIIEDQINAATSKYNEETSTLWAELKSLQAKKSAALDEIGAKIFRLQSKNKLNLRMLSEISGSDNSEEVMQSSPLLAEISALKSQRIHLGQSFQAQIDNLKAQLSKTDNRPVDAQLSELREIKSQLEQRETDLVVKASMEGRVGSILYKANEQVAPFESILTIQGNTPSFVKGYIHEDVLNNVKIGQIVWVKPKSPSGTAGIYKGQVESLGKRIVEYPQRLRKNPLVLAWGREVVINIPIGNKFLAGEKVEVLFKEPVPATEALVDWLSETWIYAMDIYKEKPIATNNSLTDGSNNEALPIMVGQVK